MLRILCFKFNLEFAVSLLRNSYDNYSKYRDTLSNKHSKSPLKFHFFNLLIHWGQSNDLPEFHKEDAAIWKDRGIISARVASCFLASKEKGIIEEEPENSRGEHDREGNEETNRGLGPIFAGNRKWLVQLGSQQRRGITIRLQISGG